MTNRLDYGSLTNNRAHPNPYAVNPLIPGNGNIDTNR
jgi:hypothetical protein